MKLHVLQTAWLAQHGVKNFSFEGKKVNVAGDVDLKGKLGHIAELPVEFGKVTGNFDISGNTLESLKNCPESVGGSFVAAGNRLTKDLEGGPKEVGGFYDVSDTQLRDLEGIPNDLYDGIDIRGINTLETLKPLTSGRIAGGSIKCDLRQGYLVTDDWPLRRHTRHTSLRVDLESSPSLKQFLDSAALIEDLEDIIGTRACLHAGECSSCLYPHHIKLIPKEYFTNKSITEIHGSHSFTNLLCHMCSDRDLFAAVAAKHDMDITSFIESHITPEDLCNPCYPDTHNYMSPLSFLEANGNLDLLPEGWMEAKYVISDKQYLASHPDNRSGDYVEGLLELEAANVRCGPDECILGREPIIFDVAGQQKVESPGTGLSELASSTKVDYSIHKKSDLITTWMSLCRGTHMLYTSEVSPIDPQALERAPDEMFSREFLTQEYANNGRDVYLSPVYHLVTNRELMEVVAAKHDMDAKSFVASVLKPEDFCHSLYPDAHNHFSALLYMAENRTLDLIPEGWWASANCLGLLQLEHAMCVCDTSLLELTSEARSDSLDAETRAYLESVVGKDKLDQARQAVQVGIGL